MRVFVTIVAVKVINITYSEFVFEALGILQTKSLCCVPMSFVASPAL